MPKVRDTRSGVVMNASDKAARELLTQSVYESAETKGKKAPAKKADAPSDSE